MQTGSHNYRKPRILSFPFCNFRIFCALFIVAISFTKPLILEAQNRQHRLYYQNIYNLNERWSINSISALWFDGRGLDWIRAELRSGGYYQFNRDIEFFATLRTHFTFAIEGNQLEIRPFQGAHIIWPRIKYLKFRHRFMIEERFFWGENLNEFNFYGRFRYRLETSIPINKPALVNNTFYIRPMAEIYINLATTDEQIRISSGKYSLVLGYRFTQKYAAEFRYEFQTTKNSVDASEREQTHLYRLRFIHTLFRNR